MNQNAGMTISVQEPVLREKLEHVLSKLSSTKTIANDIESKLFIPKLAKLCDNALSGEVYNGDELEGFVERLHVIAEQLEFQLSYINNKL